MLNKISDLLCSVWSEDWDWVSNFESFDDSNLVSWFGWANIKEIKFSLLNFEDKYPYEDLSF
jgi:hypothetical protein